MMGTQVCMLNGSQAKPVASQDPLEFSTPSLDFQLIDQIRTCRCNKYEHCVTVRTWEPPGYGQFQASANVNIGLWMLNFTCKTHQSWPIGLEMWVLDNEPFWLEAFVIKDITLQNYHDTELLILLTAVIRQSNYTEIINMYMGWNKCPRWSFHTLFIPFFLLGYIKKLILN